MIKKQERKKAEINLENDNKFSWTWKIGILGITVELRISHGIYGVSIFVLIFIILLLFPTIPLGLKASIALGGALIISILTYRFARYLVYLVLHRKISLIRTLNKELLTIMPGYREEIKDAVRILREGARECIYVPLATKNNIIKIANILKEVHENYGWERPLNINYFNFCARNLNILTSLASKIYIPVELLAKTIENIHDFQKRSPHAKHISIRNIYSGINDEYQKRDASAVVNYFKKLDQRGKIEKLSAHLRPNELEEYRKWISGKRKKLLIFTKDILNQLTSQDYNLLFENMESMKKFARNIATNIVTSETHIVLSNLIQLSNGKYLMVITATNTDKNELHIFSQMPFVWKEGKSWYYYCDQSFYPSSEYQSHWKLHHDLKEEGKKEYAFIVHCHSVDVLDYVKPHPNKIRDIKCPLGEIKTLGWILHGSEIFGSLMSSAMSQNDVPAVVIEDHGIWVSGSSFAEAEKNLREIVDFTSEQLSS